MVRQCFVCKKTFKKASERSFHMFPKDIHIRKKWFSVLCVDETSLYLSKYTYVCSDHFTASDFLIKPSGVRHLRKGAIPSLLGMSIRVPEPKHLSSDSETETGSDSMLCCDLNDVTMNLPVEKIEIVEEELLDVKPFLIGGRRMSSSSTATASETEMMFNIVDFPCSPTKIAEESNLLAKESLSERQSVSSANMVTESENGIKIIVENPPERLAKENLRAEKQNISSADTATESESGVKITVENPKKSRHIGHKRYFGDIDSDDFVTVREAKKCWSIAKSTVSEQKRKIRSLQQTNRRLTARLKCLRSELNFLKKNQSIAESAATRTEHSSKINSTVEPAQTEVLKQMEQLLFDKICRACLSPEAEETAFIFEVTYEDIGLWEIFNNCVAVQIERDDILPKNICKSCITALVQIYTFKQQCQRSDDTLRAVVTEQNHILSAPEEDITKDTVIEEATVLDKVELESKINNNGNGVSGLTSCRNARRKRCKYKSKIMDKACVLSSKPSFTCKHCNETFDLFSELKTHRQQAKHPRLRNLTCKVCNKSFSINYFKQHMRIHTKEKPFACNVCQKRFSLKRNLRRHVMTHTGERPHTCHICGKGFIQAITLVDHIRIHTGETPFVCSYCGLSFRRSSRHQAHLKRHLIEKEEHLRKKRAANNPKANGNYGCDVCHKYFMTKGILKMHMQIHGEKKFLCSHCGKGFVTNGGLVSHLKIHTGIKPFPCTVCNKAFSQTGGLQSHMLIHTGETPFVCEVCSKAYTQRNHLKYHMRTHSGERPYACVYCEKSFASSGTLKVHVRTHTGETPYICDVCGKGFYGSSSMKKHKRGHRQFDEKGVNQTNTVSD